MLKKWEHLTMTVAFKYSRLALPSVPERIQLQQELWSLWSAGTRCFIWAVTLHANLLWFLKELLFFFLCSPRKIDNKKENIHFWQLTLLGQSIFEVFFVGCVVKITNLLCSRASVMYFYKKSWLKLNFRLEMFSCAVFGILIHQLPVFVEKKVNQAPDAYHWKHFKALLKVGGILMFSFKRWWCLWQVWSGASLGPVPSYAHLWVRAFKIKRINSSQWISLTFICTVPLYLCKSIAFIAWCGRA